MALTLKRWVAIAVLACAAIAVWQLPPRDGVARAGARTIGTFVPSYGYVRRYGWPDVATKLQSATLHLRLLELRDSVFTTHVTASAAPGFRVLVDHEFPDSIQRSVTSAFDAAWRGYDAGRRYPVIAAVVQDTTRTLEGLPMALTSVIDANVFPPDSATPVCRVLARVRMALSGRSANDNLESIRKSVATELVTESTERTILSPCAMYATFGDPGPAVASWLAKTNWRAGRSVAWSRAASPWNDDYSGRYRIPEPLVDFTGRSSRTWQMRSELSSDGIACVGGDDAGCVSGVEEPAVAIRGEEDWNTAVISVQSPMYLWRSEAVGSLGPSTGWILSDMVHDLGRDRFQRFWSSSDSLPAAFEHAAGVPLGTWLRTWAQAMYGPDVLGPSIPARGRVAGVLVLVVGLVVAAAFASRRDLA
ncbi:MAG TPA: hypothetical protein VF722_01495 [Gemmatimonadaceae bacterium]